MFKMKKNIKKLKSEGSSCIEAAFKIFLSIQQLLRLLPREICIFINVCWQIIGEAKWFNNIYVKSKKLKIFYKVKKSSRGQTAWN